MHQYTSATRLLIGTGIACAVGLTLTILVFMMNEKPARPAQPAPVSPEEAQLLLDLFDSVRPGVDDRDGSPEVHQTLKELAALASPQRPLWPVVTYLRGEHHRRHGETRRARDAFRTLAQWAVSDYPGGPYEDTWGGSGLAVVALWRWLQIEAASGTRLDPADLDSLMDVASKLQQTRFYARMANPQLLAALPRLDEQVRHLLARVAWNNERFDDARVLYLDFMAVDFRGPRQDRDEDEIRNSVLREGLATAERIDSYAGRRRLSLALPRPEKDEAAAVLKQLYDNPEVSPDVRAAAGYEWAYYMRQRRSRTERRTVLTNVMELTQDEAIIERALFRLDRLTDIVERYPTGRFYDDALKRLADNHLYRGELEEALARYEQLREIERAHDFEDSAYLSPALGLIARGGHADLGQAAGLLQDYLADYPNGVFRLRSLFWLGRIAERRNDETTSEAYFNRVVEEAPYNYYALRARMHLEHGEDARLESIPVPESRVRRELEAAYEASRRHNEAAVGGSPFSSPYRERLRTAITAGLYGELVRVNRIAIDETFSQRLDNIPLADLDDLELVPSAAMLLAFRQDALAAIDRDPEPQNRLELARLLTTLNPGAADWPLALEMTSLKYHSDSISYTERRRLTAMQRHEQYLATAYPNLRRLPVIGGQLADAAWEIDGSRELSLALMYATVRHESRFYSDAISAPGAMGLFQFMPYVFDAVNRQYFNNDLLLGSSTRPRDFLFDSGRNIALWACWRSVHENQIVERRELAESLMQHHAGPGNLVRWQTSTYGRNAEADRDVEFMIEVARFPESRNFVSQALMGVAVAEAAGIASDLYTRGNSRGPCQMLESLLNTGR